MAGYDPAGSAIIRIQIKNFTWRRHRARWKISVPRFRMTGAVTKDLTEMASVVQSRQFRIRQDPAGGGGGGGGGGQFQYRRRKMLVAGGTV